MGKPYSLAYSTCAASKETTENILRFVLDRVHLDVRRRVHFAVTAGPGKRIRGWAYSPRALPAGFKLPNGRSHFVNVEVGERVSYPHTSQHRATTEAVVFGCVEDELIHVLAHEAAHAMQQLGVQGFGNARYYEVEAERFAIGITRQWHLRDAA